MQPAHCRTCLANLLGVSSKRCLSCVLLFSLFAGTVEEALRPIGDRWLVRPGLTRST